MNISHSRLIITKNILIYHSTSLPAQNSSSIDPQRQLKQQPLQQTTTTTTTEHTAANMHQEGDPPPPPPHHRATNNLAPEYFRGLTTENADLWMISIEN